MWPMAQMATGSASLALLKSVYALYNLTKGPIRIYELCYSIVMFSQGCTKITSRKLSSTNCHGEN